MKRAGKDDLNVWVWRVHSKTVTDTRDDLLTRLRAAQSVLACAEPGRRLDPCTCWHGYEAAIRIVEEAL